MAEASFTTEQVTTEAIELIRVVYGPAIGKDDTKVPPGLTEADFAERAKWEFWQRLALVVLTKRAKVVADVVSRQSVSPTVAP